ncbi:MAG: vanadium-dependent haloperoxidase [Cyclobacteriaceae bacterium]
MKEISFYPVVTIVMVIICLLSSCESTNDAYKEQASNPMLLHKSMKGLTDIIVHDIFSPPVASRIYAYTSIAAYEILKHEQSGFVSLAGQINGLKPFPEPDPASEYCLSLSAVQALMVIGRKMIFSEDKLDVLEDALHENFKSFRIPKKVYQRSVDYGNEVAKHVMDWASEDNYNQSRSFPKYSVINEEYAWKPTPPDYMEGIEPNWNKIRTLAMDSCNQFMPPPPTPFSLDPDSQFYAEMIEVYEAVNTLCEDKTDIAKFWDCNPYVSHHKGHTMFATKKITPGGHWMEIAGIASRKANFTMTETAETYVLTSIALFDAFIACWDEKWRSILIRPETVINKYLDESWAPLLQTPPFPEYTSGHSVISTAAAHTLTELFGENFQFNDSSEVDYGLPVRSFNSFVEASQEAAISRLYGGIHYRPAIENGVAQGLKVSALIKDRIHTRESGVTQNQ